MSDSYGGTMKIIKRINTYHPKELDFYLFTDGEFLFHGVEVYRLDNVFEKREHEHPVEITKTPWKLFDKTRDNDEDNPDIWVFKRDNGNTEELIMLREISRMKIKELKLDECKTS